jgi:hypothetical protein
MRPIFLHAMPPVEGEILLPAKAAHERAGVGFLDRWGPDVAVPAGGAVHLAWAFEAKAGAYELWAQYAAADPRPVEIELNGRAVLKGALADITFGWAPEHQAWVYQGRVELDAGKARLAVSHTTHIPHIRALKLTPAAGENLPDVTLRQEMRSSLPARPLADEALYELVRAAAPAVRALMARGVDGAAVQAALAATVSATAQDLAAPQKRQGFGPMNGQVIRQSLFRALDRLLQFDAFVETGSFLGTTTEMLASYARPVFACESTPDYFYRSAVRLAERANVRLFAKDSRAFLQHFFAHYASEFKLPFFYLDAHSQDVVPLPDEISIISARCTDYLMMIDDFKHPLFAYGYGKYKSGELRLEHLLPKLASTNGLAFLFPIHPPHLESGFRRGTLVIAPEHLAQRIADAGLPLMRQML